MSTADKVRAARSAQEAMLVLAEALDTVLEELAATPQSHDPWGEWPGTPAEFTETLRTETDAALRESKAEFEARIERQHQEALAAMANTEAREIELPPASADKQERRRLLARQQLKLNDVLPGADITDWNETYVKGGPVWLYNADREVLMSFDYPVRQQMIADVEEDNPQLAYEMSLDILKQPAGEPDFENGSGALAVGWVKGGKS